MNQEKKKKYFRYKTYVYFCDFDCTFLYNYMNVVDNNTFSSIKTVMRDNCVKDSEIIKKILIEECKDSKSYYIFSISQCNQLYNIYFWKNYLYKCY